MSRIAPIIRTDETTEAIGAVEKALAELRATKANPDNWKWTIIALHNALQGFLVLALRFTNPAVVGRVPKPLRNWDEELRTAQNELRLVKDLRDKVREKYLAHVKSLVRDALAPAELQDYLYFVESRPVNLWGLDYELITFGELFERIQDATYAPYTPQPSKFPFVATEAQKSDVAHLNHLRNEYIHFTPKSLTIVLEGSHLPRMVLSCAEVMLYLVEQGSVLWRILPTKEGADLPTTLQLRMLRDEARTIGADYGTPI